MAGYQQTIIIGNVGRDPELRFTQSGVAVCDFSVAVTRKWTQNEQPREETTWYRISAWRSLAELCNQYVHKGMQIMVAGRVNASAYIGKDGEAHASLELVATDVQFLGRRGENDGDDQAQAGAAREQDDLPF